MAVTWSCKLCMQKNSLDSESCLHFKEVGGGTDSKWGTTSSISLVISFPKDQCITCGRSADWKPSGEMEVYRCVLSESQRNAIRWSEAIRRRDTPTAGALATWAFSIGEFVRKRLPFCQVVNRIAVCFKIL